ncbi:MAG: hypothetical protein AMJ60_05390 [Desulfobacterales bacterium SG8_35]|nr:MAG: hypothetical protein AMJ60_05390 [Desulfobacterales bacterium SG8_35]
MSCSNGRLALNSLFRWKSLRHGAASGKSMHSASVLPKTSLIFLKNTLPEVQFLFSSLLCNILGSPWSAPQYVVQMHSLMNNGDSRVWDSRPKSA